MKLWGKAGILLAGMMIVAACKEKYVANVTMNANYLVIEGFINGGTGATTITLTRSSKVSDSANLTYERGALVRVLAETGASTTLAETQPGIYSYPQLTLNSATRYCLNIHTKDGKEYQSDYSSVRTTPAIDSVSWKRKDGGVQLYVNTHDPSSSTKYYQWKYEESWEFHSKYISTLKVVLDSIGVPLVAKPRWVDVTWRDPQHPGVADSSIFRCWKFHDLSSILVGSSEKLSSDVIFEQPLTLINNTAQQLSVLYSINVKQYALSNKAYLFLQQLKKNTESLGSIFDAQPSDNNGNFQCLSNPGEPVIGFVEVTRETSKRIFISAAQVPNWNYAADCPEQFEINNLPDEVRAPSPLRAPSASSVMTIPAQYGGSAKSGILSVYFAQADCVDCTLTGSNKKPAYWP